MIGSKRDGGKLLVRVTRIQLTLTRWSADEECDQQEDGSRREEEERRTFYHRHSPTEKTNNVSRSTILPPL